MGQAKINSTKKIKQDHVKMFFNDHAKMYQRHLKEHISGWRMFINSHYNRFFGDLNGRLLDLGSGNSWYYDEEKYEKVIFLDYAINMLKTREKKNNSIFINGDASYIPLKDDSVDLILINSCLHHLARNSIGDSDKGLLSCLKECKRVLKKDGRILIFEGHIPDVVEVIYRISFPILSYLTRLFQKPMVRPLSRSTLLDMIKKASLSIVRNERIFPDCRVALAGCLLGNNRFLLNPKLYPWKFYVYFLGK